MNFKLHVVSKIGTKLRDTAPEIKEGLCVATKGPFICFWNWGKDLLTDSPYTGPCMGRLGILSCHKGYGLGSPHSCSTIF